MSSNGYFDVTENTLFARSVESWADYTSWTEDSAGNLGFTTWAGTPSSNLEFTSNIIDAGTVDYHMPIITCDSATPITIEMNYSNTVDSTGGALDSPTTVTIAPSTSNITVPYARFFTFKIIQGTGDSAGAEDSGGSPELSLQNLSIIFRSNTATLTQSNIDTSTLGGSVGARELSFNQTTGTITNCLIQPHITGLDDSGGDPVRPLIYIDKTSTPVVLNIFDADSYGKARRIDCTIDVQIQYLPQLQSDVSGQTEIA
tara:strand:- start:1639 stop:2412 length:774 start_codon:yes stop_codon:yes gene_type:complete